MKQTAKHWYVACVLVCCAGNLANSYNPPTKGDFANAVCWLGFSPNGKTLAIVGNGGTIFCLELNSGKDAKHIKLFEKGSIRCGACSPQGNLFAAACVGGLENPVRVLELSSGRVLHLLAGHNRAALCVAFSPDGKVLASGGEEGAILLWDPTTAKKIRTLTGHWHQIE